MMSIIHTYLSTAETKRLSQRDNDYLRQKISISSALSNLLNKPVNRAVLAELRCILDGKPIHRQNTEQHRKNSKVRVYNADGRLIRIEHGNGKVMKQLEV